MTNQRRVLTVFTNQKPLFYLDILVQNNSWLGVTKGRPVLIQEIHQLLRDDPGGQEKLLPPELVRDVPGPAREELRHLLGRELGLADVAEVSGEVDGLACNK